MPDHRKPDRADRSRPVVDRPESGGDRGTPQRPDQTHPGRPPKAASIKVVSDLLSLKKPALDRTSAPTPARFPKFPRSIEATISDLMKSPSLRAKLWPARTTLEPPPVALPEGGSPVETRSDEPSEAGSPEATAGSHRPLPFPIPSGSIGRGPDPAGSPPESRGLASGIGSSSILIREGQGSLGPSIGPGESTPSVAPMIENRFTLRDPGAVERAGLPGEQAGPSGAVQAPSVDLPREARSSTGSGAGLGADAVRASRSALEPGAATNPSARVASSTVAVRNPLAFGLGRLSAASQDSPGSGGISDRVDPSGIGAGAGSAEPSFGGPATTRGGESIDLSKTNELLRQLLDAVKKQRDASLPVGGQSVYPGR